MSTEKTKVLVVVFGCFSRSLTITDGNHHEKIYKILENENILYEIHYIDNFAFKIDGRIQEQIDEKILRSNNYQKYIQPNINKIIRKYYKPWRLRATFSAKYYSVHGFHPFQQKFLEHNVSKKLLKNKNNFDKAIVFCSDFWFEKEIDLNWFKHDCVIVSDQNKGYLDKGITNGFYAGNIDSVALLLEGFYKLGLKMQDYENSLRIKSVKENINICEINFRFLKIRTDGEPAYKGIEKFKKVWAKVAHLLQGYIAFRLQQTKH